MDLQRFASMASSFAGVAVLIGFGALAAWRGLLNSQQMQALSTISINLLWPAFAFWHGVHDLGEGALREAPVMVCIGLAFGILGYVVTGIAGRFAHWQWPRLPVLRFVGGLGNTGSLGVPICTALLGARGGLLALLFDCGTSLILYALIVPSLAPPDPIRRSGWSLMRLWIRRLANPVSVALLLGVSVAALGWELPALLTTPLSQMAGALVPMMLLALGAILYQYANATRPARRDLILPVFLKMALLPALAFVALLLFPLTPISHAVVILQASMPSAMTAPVFAQRYGADEMLAASAVMSSTTLAMLTLPFITSVLPR